MPRSLALLFVLAATSVSLFANALTDTEHTETRPVGVLSARLAAGYSHSYFDNIPTLRQDSTLGWTDSTNTVRLGSQIVGGSSNTDGKFNAVLNAGYDRYLLSWFEVFAFTNYESQVIASIQGKFITGGGGKVVFIKSKQMLLDFSMAPVYVQTQYANLPLKEELSISARARFRVELTRGLNLSIPYFVIADTRDTRNQWHSLEPALSYAFTDYADVSGGYRYRYNLLNQSFAGTIYVTAAVRFKN